MCDTQQSDELTHKSAIGSTFAMNTNETLFFFFFSVFHFIRALPPPRLSVTQLFLIYCICSHKVIKLLVVAIIISLENMNVFHFPSLLLQIKGFVTLKKQTKKKNEATITFCFSCF